jgi:L-fuculose-phosphate aldolase
LGNIRTAEYFAPSSDSGVQIIAHELVQGDAFILDRHGSLTVGSSMREALFRLERMERAAQITGMAIQLGGQDLRRLKREEIEELLAIKRSRGEIPTEVPGCNECGACLLPGALKIVPPSRAG